MSLTQRPRGRPFPKGNGGRRPGSKNKATLVMQALASGQPGAILQKAAELARAGDITLLKMFASRFLPKERTVQIDLPRMDQANDAVDVLAAILQAVATGQITPNEGSALANLVGQYVRALNATDLELRLDNLEKQLEEIKSPLEQELKPR